MSTKLPITDSLRLAITRCGISHASLERETGVKRQSIMRFVRGDQSLRLDKEKTLGVGEAGYKNAWCDVAEPLFDTLLPVSATGRARSTLEAARLALKRRIKQTPWIWALAKKVRAKI